MITRLLSSSLFLFVFTGTLFAQDSGDLSGKVVDDKDHSIAFATISVKNNGRPVTDTKADFDGFYSITSLATGTYDVEISFIGFTTSIITGVKIIPNKTVRLEVKLEPKVSLRQAIIISYKDPSGTNEGVYSTLNIRGGRGYPTSFYLDGTRVSAFGALHGRVFGKNNQGIPDATIVVDHQYGFDKTDANGHYRINYVPVGKNHITIYSSGYRTSFSNKVKIGDGKMTTFNKRLQKVKEQ